MLLYTVNVAVSGRNCAFTRDAIFHTLNKTAHYIKTFCVVLRPVVKYCSSVHSYSRIDLLAALH